jgi:hypothetical protein
MSSLLQKLQQEYMIVSKGGGRERSCSCSRNTNTHSGGRCCCSSGMTFGGNR